MVVLEYCIDGATQVLNLKARPPKNWKSKHPNEDKTNSKQETFAFFTALLEAKLSDNLFRVVAHNR